MKFLANRERNKWNTERLSAKVWNNRFNRTHCSKQQRFALFLVLPGRVET